jgi:hypothetical protein
MDQDWTDDQATAVKEAFTEFRSELDRTFDEYPTKEAVLKAIDARIEAARATRGREYAGGGGSGPTLPGSG